MRVASTHWVITYNCEVGGRCGDETSIIRCEVRGLLATIKAQWNFLACAFRCDTLRHLDENVTAERTRQITQIRIIKTCLLRANLGLMEPKVNNPSRQVGNCRKRYMGYS